MLPPSFLEAQKEGVLKKKHLHDSFLCSINREPSVLWNMGSTLRTAGNLVWNWEKHAIWNQTVLDWVPKPANP